MLLISQATLSKKACNTGEKITISVEIKEKSDFPFDFPFDYPIFTESIALPQKNNITGGYNEAYI